VLVTAPSNVAVDLIMAGFIGHNALNVAICRVGRGMRMDKGDYQKYTLDGQLEKEKIVRV
jgi:hypothetical protein